MPSNHLFRSRAVRLLSAAVLWLCLIAWAHWKLNFQTDVRARMRLGYMPVVTNLSAPILDRASQDDGPVRFEAIKFSSFSDMASALRDGHLDAAFMIAPLAIVLKQQGAAVKVVYVGNRHESTLVARNDLKARGVSDLVGRTVAVPMRFSGHNLALRLLMKEAGLGAESIEIVEMNPPDMAAGLRTGELDAYFVGEPFAALAVRSGDASVVHYVEEVWPDFICNLVLVTEDVIRTRPQDVRLLVQGAARAGYWARRNPDPASTLASKYWNQSEEITRYALNEPQGRIVYDQFVPVEAELELLAERMVEFGLIDSDDASNLIEDRFAREADLTDIAGLKTIITHRLPKPLGRHVRNSSSTRSH